MAEPTNYINHPLTRKQLRQTMSRDRSLGLLAEQLCVDTLFVQHDDFDTGIDPTRWITSNFQWEENDLQGGISSLRDDDEDTIGGKHDAHLISRTLGWRGARRPTFMTRLRLGTLAGKYEVGFVDREITTGFGAVTDKSTPTSGGVTNFAVAAYDVGDTSSFDLVADGSAVSIAKSTPSVALTLTGEETTIMVALNEQGETRLWVNGILTSTLRTGPNALTNLGLWIHTNAPLYVDYTHAWQERADV